MTETTIDRPEVLNGRTIRLPTPCGGFYLTLNECQDRLTEVRMLIGKSGSCQRMLFETIAILLSVLLQANVPKEKIKNILQKQLEANCGNRIYSKGHEYHSCIDFCVQKMLEDMGGYGQIALED